MISYKGKEYVEYDNAIALLEEKDKEIERLKEEYIMLQNASDEVEEEKDKEIARLTAESTKWESKFYDEAKKVDKAIEYIKFNATSNYFDAEKNMFRREIDLLEILGGGDKE